MLLKRLRDTMARGATPEETLGEVVRLVANEMVAEVCSIYLLRAGEVLELFATQGLNPSAVHRTRLRVGEGLVGDIAAHARPLALDDAQSHPQFAYRPETGEEIYHSLAGVPIVRAGRVLGVLVVQNRTQAPLRRGRDRDAADHRHGAGGNGRGGTYRQSQRGAAGRWPGPAAAAHRRRAAHAGHRDRPRRAARAAIVIQRVVAEDVGVEQTRFEEALGAVRDDVDRLLEADDMQSGEHREILETFRMFADDRGWIERCARRSLRVSPAKRACSAPSTTCALGSANRPIPTSVSG
jgi:phosphotransferase system enzyme I (PtsP)